MRQVVSRYWAALCLLAMIALTCPVDTALGRDRGPRDVRGREATVSRHALLPRQPVFNPAAVRATDRYGPRAGASGTRPPERRPRLYERVESDIDRGAGRIEDEQTYQLRRLRADRDERLGRVVPRREAERFEEEYDRRRRIEQRRQRQRQVESTRSTADAAPGVSPARPPTAVDQTPAPGGSTLARFVAEQEALLSGAREGYQRDLTQAEADRDAAIAAAGSRQARSAARQQFDARRSTLTRGYQEYRRKILGGNQPGR